MSNIDKLRDDVFAYKVWCAENGYKPWEGKAIIEYKESRR